jgi:hypothetical protein
MSTAGFPTTVPSFGMIEDGHLKVEKIARELEAVATYAKGALNPVGVIDLTGGFILATGAPLAVFANGASAVPGTELNNSKAIGIRWNNNATFDQVLSGFVVPKDADVSLPFTVYMRVSKSANTTGDATTFGVAAYNQVTGALADADTNYGGTSAAILGNAAAKTLQVTSVALAAVDLPAVGSGITLLLGPTNGTCGTDDVTIHNVWVEYTKLHA